jgi:hypothetical protein
MEATIGMIEKELPFQVEKLILTEVDWQGWCGPWSV